MIDQEYEALRTSLLAWRLKCYARYAAKVGALKMAKVVREHNATLAGFTEWCIGLGARYYYEVQA